MGWDALNPPFDFAATRAYIEAMETTHEVWDALAKFFLNVANGMILAGIVAYIFQDKDLIAGAFIVTTGIITLVSGLYLTGVAARLKKEER